MKAFPLYLLVILFAQTTLFGQDRLFSVEDLKVDLEQYEYGLTQVHPNAFQWYPRDSFEVWIDRAEQHITRPMTSMEFRKILMPIHQKVGCGHSRLSPPWWRSKAEKKKTKQGLVRYLLPFVGKVYNNKLYVIKDVSKDSLFAKGTEITAIDGLPVSNIIDSLSLFLTSDGYNQTHFHLAISRKFSSLYRAYFSEKKNFTISYIDESKKEQEISCAAYPVSKALTKSRAKAKKELVMPRDTTPKKKELVFKKKAYRFWHSLEDPSLYILRIPGFKGGHGKRFHKKVLRYLNELETPNRLAIDLRGNGGGNAEEATTLVSMLCPEPFYLGISGPHQLEKKAFKLLSTNKLRRSLHRWGLMTNAEEKTKGETVSMRLKIEPHKRIQYRGPLFVLIDGYSFSAASLVSAYLKDQDRATFIGTETGGGQFGTNALSTPFFDLPNSGVRVRMPMWRLDQLVQGENVGRGVMPDVKTEWRIEDVLEGKDVDLEVVKGM